jgi:hypothetical protein
MLLNQLVEINEKGIVASSVNFGMMDDPQMNLNLCEGFIFNYDPKKPERSTVGILDKIRRSYHSRTEPNIHLMIQQYGRGKSHFAIAIANYFKKPYKSPEVRGILRQLEVATLGESKAIFERLQLYKQKQHQKHLVICLSGDRGGDIKKHFLQTLLKGLEEEGIKDSLAQHICSEPLRYLESLNTEDRNKAENYLASQGNPDGDLNTLIRLLQQNNPAVIPAVKNLARHVTSFLPDFSADIDIEAILKDILNNLCSGANPHFQGILILFDELNYYLQSWAADQIGAGGTALQNITNICERYKGKIALLSFAQIDLDKAIGISATDRESYRKISSRLTPKDSTYYPESSLELVINNLLIQKEDTYKWKEFYARWNNTLLSEARIAYEQRIKFYQYNGWSLDRFNRHLSQGCFPLHPITAYLLCKLNFTQDRTAIQFIKGYVKDFIQNQPVEASGKINYIYPIALIDTFIENFSNYPVYTVYQKAQGLVAGSDDPDELVVLKALFLYYASGDKLTKSDREDHEEVLTTLTGLSRAKLKAVLNKLMQTREIVYYQPGTKLYRFFEGINPTEIEEQIEEEITNKENQAKEPFIKQVVEHCEKKIKQYLDNETITATQFVKDNNLVGDDWQFKYKVYSIDGFIRALSSDSTLRNIEEKGIFAYVLAETQEELQEFRREVDKHLASSPHKQQIAVAIPSEPTGDLARVLLKIDILKNKDSTQKRLFGVACEQLLQRWIEQVNKQVENLLGSCTYHCIALEKIPPVERNKPQRIISTILQESYSFVPPVDEIDKMRADHQTGSKIVGFAAKQLLADSLTPQGLPDRAYSTVIDTIFVSRWGLLKKTSQKYIVQEPTHEKIKAAWDKISQMSDLTGLSEKIVNLEKVWQVLSKPPYGYSELTFTVLLAGWLVYHHKEVVLKGVDKLSLKKNEQATTKTQSLKDWANTDIWQKPKDFVHKWVVNPKSQLIRRQKAKAPELPSSPMNYDRAQQYLTDAAAFLEADDLDRVEFAEVNQNRQRVTAKIEEINAWFKPVEEADLLSPSVALDVLFQLYPQLLAPLPAIDLRPNTISVRPTQEQRDRASQALQTVCQQIEKSIAAQSDRAQTLTKEENCDTYKIEIENIIRQIEEVSSLPEHLVTSLRNALQVADQTKAKIQEQVKIGECLSEIHRLYNQLNENSTQEDYSRTRAEITTLAQRIPDRADEAGEVRQVLQDIEQRYQELNQKIEIWEERASGVISRQQILELNNEIERQRRCFTEEASNSRIKKLQEQLRGELLNVQERDDAEKLIRAELDKIQNKLQRIRDLHINKISEAFQVFQQLMNSNLPSTGEAALLEEYQKKVEEFKSHGRKAIADQFARIYGRQLIRLEEYETLKNALETSRTILADVEDFTDIKANIEQAFENLEIRHSQLQRQKQEQELQTQDKKIIQAIRQLKPIKTHTNRQCEDGINQIEELRNRLNMSEQFQTEIDQILQSFREKIAVNQRNLLTLKESLSKAENLKELERISTEYAKLEFFFQDSTDYQDYQALQELIQLLRNDLEQVRDLETRASQSNSIATCSEILAVIENEQLTLHERDRFQGRIAQLADNLRKEIQTYTQELNEFEQELEASSIVQAVQRLQEKVLQKAARYSGSEQESRYQTIVTEIKLLVDLLQMAKTGERKTVEICQEQIAKLQKWKNSFESLSPNLQERFDSISQEIEETKAQILARQKVAAEEWLNNIEHQGAQLSQLIDDTKRLDAANKLLKQIQTQKSQHIELLNPDRQQSLANIERQCIEEQSKDKTNKIIVLFQQLPHLERQSLYEQLAQYLSDATEEFNG